MFLLKGLTRGSTRIRYENLGRHGHDTNSTPARDSYDKEYIQVKSQPFMGSSSDMLINKKGRHRRSQLMLQIDHSINGTIVFCVTTVLF